MKIGSLFSGAGGLDLAVEHVFGARTVWHSENDPAATTVLARHWPGVPNLGDITRIDWAEVEPVDVLCGGFPCTDVSSAGRRAGLHNTRSGLWVHFAKAIDALRPRLVVIENVRGLLSAHANRPLESDDPAVGNTGVVPVLRAAGAVLGDLADLGYDAQWATVAASDVGAPHRRERVFILAHPADAAQPERGGTQHDHLGATSPRTTEPRECFSAHPRSGGAPADSACDGRHERRPEPARLERGPDAAVSGARPVNLLPTPCAQQSGNTPENHLAKKPGREVVTDLAILVENGLLETGGALLPTPNTQDGNGGGRYNSVGHQTTLPGEIRLLPTPKSSDGQRQDCDAEHRRNTPSLISVAHYLPTPNASDCTGGAAHPDSWEGHSHQLIDYILLHNTDRWGRYAPAIQQWEHLTRPAPDPTEPNRNGKPRLNPEFASWMMGWPAGWVTDVPGISRNAALRIIGNGVVPQQAIAALQQLLTVCGAAA